MVRRIPWARSLASVFATALLAGGIAQGQESPDDGSPGPPAAIANDAAAGDERAGRDGQERRWRQRMREELREKWEQAPPALKEQLRRAYQQLAQGEASGGAPEAHEETSALPPDSALTQEPTEGARQSASPDTGAPLLLAGLAGLLLLILMRLIRRAGHLVVCMEYPSDLRGTFSVQIARRKSALRRMRGVEQKITSRFLHHMVSRESQFRSIRPGRYWVAVEGVIQDPDSEDPLSRPYQCRSVYVRSRRTARLEFDFRPRASVVTAKIFWNGRPVKEASLSLFGQPGSLRRARGSQLTLDLPLGVHRLLVGCEDRVLERELEIENLEATQVELELSSPELLLFKGCPPAVEPYLRGDLFAAARELEREGQVKLASRLQARLHEENGRTDRAAELYEKAGDTENAIRLLQEVTPEHPSYAEACDRLADAFERDGRLELAIERIERAIEVRPGADENPDRYARLATVFASMGELTRALEVLQQLRALAPKFPDLDGRIEEIEKQLADANSSTEVLETSRYELVEQIGAGGMGVVFRARDRRLGREVALKRLPENLREHPTAVQLFLREAQAAAALNHPNIVTLFDADEEEGHFFITMELLDGSPLAALVKSHGKLEPRDVALLGQQISAGLAYAHERRIVHRDIKPGNLFFTRDKVVKIMDFGLAKMIEEVRKAATLVGGTPYYMAPEQSKGGEAVGTPADQYALGITLFELGAGRVPFREGDVTYEHRHTPAPDPREYAPELPDPLARLILELLHKDPAQRPDAPACSERLGEIARSA